VTVALRKSFGSLSVPNYRRYFTGQLVSISGNWMQNVAEAWLLLTLTGSGVAIGALTAAQFLPVLLFAAWGGVVADRFAKRRLLMVTQTAMAVPALALLAAVVAGAVEPWMIFATAFLRGSVNSIDNPARQSFVIEMVGPERVVNAVSLNSVIVQASRIVGPGIAGALIALWGTGPCMAVNALTFAVMIVALVRMDPAELRATNVVRHERGAVRAAVRHVRRTPELAIPLAMMALVGTLAFNFQTVLPLLAHFTFGLGAGGYATLLAAMGAGSIAGALVNGARGRTGARVIVAAALGFGVSGLLAASAPSFALEVAALVPLGAFSVVFASSVNSHLQLEVEPAMRGRVMALYSIVFLGSTPIGGPLTGWLSGAVSPRAGLVVAGLAALAAAAGARFAFRRRPEPAVELASPSPLPSPPRTCPAPARPSRASRAAGTTRSASRRVARSARSRLGRAERAEA
jgi:MFS family permease